MTTNQRPEKLCYLILLMIIAGLHSCSNSNEPARVRAASTTATTVTEIAKTAEVPGKYYGIDISHYQGDEAKELGPEDSLTFVICKATQGVDKFDNDFETNINTIKAKGYIYGAYHFYETNKDPAAQATHFWNTLVSKNGVPEIAPIVDIEAGSIPNGMRVDIVQMRKYLNVFLKKLDTLSGRRPLIYTARAFADNYLFRSHIDTINFANYDLWLAEYTEQSKPTIPHTWQGKSKGIGYDYKIWQKSQSHTIRSKPNDFDVYYGTLSDLKK
jgi:lysozyme